MSPKVAFMWTRIAYFAKALPDTFFLLFVAVSVQAQGPQAIYDSEQLRDQAPLAPDAAVAGFQVPDGLKVRVIAAEPIVQNPIAMTWDGRGRLWVAENYTYSERALKFDMNLRDRVQIFSDEDGDGVWDDPITFTDQVQRLTGIEVGRDGVWLMCPPRLLFIPDRDHDDRPDGPPQVMLDGFKVPPENYHTVANGIHWGPDGWLYGRCGASSQGLVRAPEMPEEQAVPIYGGVWRFHPNSHVFEPLCHGTTNPWGHDWDEHGEAFFVNTVNGHLWHLIPGAHFKRPHTLTPNPLVYDSLDMHADHYHWDTGKPWTDSRSASGKHDELGGGHAHCGAMIYLGNQWPATYRGKLFTLNLHGRRVNQEQLVRSGSGYVAKHAQDILRAADPFFRGLDLNYGPEGSVYVLDWSDIGECHEQTGVHRRSGRIYQVSAVDHAASSTNPVQLTAASLDELWQMQSHVNEWYVRQSSKEIINRAARKESVDTVIQRAAARVVSDEPTPRRLSSLWLLHALQDLNPEQPLTNIDWKATHQQLLADSDEHLRVWSLRLLTDRWLLDTAMSEPRSLQLTDRDTAWLPQFVELASNDSSALVRLALASILQRLPLEHRPALAIALSQHASDAEDHNLPWMIWYGLTPLVKSNPEALIPIAQSSRIPLVRQNIARAISEQIKSKPVLLETLLKENGNASLATRIDLVKGIAAGLEGRRKATPPETWASFSKGLEGNLDESMTSTVRSLSVIFGDGRALDEVRQIVSDDHAPLELRKTALESLIEAEPSDLKSVCQKLLGTRFLNRVALSGLTRFDDPALGQQLARSYRSFHASDRAVVLETLVSRPSFATALLDEMARGNIPRSELSAVQARQLRSFGDEKLTARLTEAWGELRETPADRKSLIQKWRTALTPETVAGADRKQGRRLFDQHCASCHRLFGAGGEIGPELTGANRRDMDYILDNLIDPSAVVNKDFLMSVLLLVDGRVVNGIVLSENKESLSIQTAQMRLTILKEEIETRQLSKQSMMPDGLLQTLSEPDVRNLIGYLSGASQVEPAP